MSGLYSRLKEKEHGEGAAAGPQVLPTAAEVRQRLTNGPTVPPAPPGRPPTPTTSTAAPAGLEAAAQWRADLHSRRQAVAETAVAPGRPQRPAVDPALRGRVQKRLAEQLEAAQLTLSGRGGQRQRQEILVHILALLAAEGGIPPLEQDAVAQALYDDIMGLGPLQPLLDDDSVSEIMVNGPDHVYVERGGRLEPTGLRFQDDAQVLQLIERIVAPLGRRIDEATPMVDARLLDGSRVNAIIPPLALKGPTVTIRKFARSPITVADLIRFGTLTDGMATFLQACVAARLNIIVAGGTGSGKTTMLNVLSSFIPSDERIVTIEDAAELQLRQDHVVALETRPANIEGRGEVSIRHLVKNALRMRPDRIVVGECRGGEAVDMLQAMNTGHDGSLTTAHANSPRDVISRLETMVLMAGMDLPLRAIREQVASALDLIVQCARLRDGTRRITHIAEVQGMEGEVVVLQDLFGFRQEGLTPEGRIIGRHLPSGIRPRFLERLADAGCEVPFAVFFDAAELV